MNKKQKYFPGGTPIFPLRETPQKGSESAAPLGYEPLSEMYIALRSASIKLADAADAYQCGDGDRMTLEDAIISLYRITGI